MRIDKYLKVSRIVKRRQVAADMCNAGRILINGKPAKPSSEVKIGDILEMHTARDYRFEVLSVAEHARKEDAAAMFRQLQ